MRWYSSEGDRSALRRSAGSGRGQNLRQRHAAYFASYGAGASGHLRHALPCGNLWHRAAKRRASGLYHALDRSFGTRPGKAFRNGLRQRLYIPASDASVCACQRICLR